MTPDGETYNLSPDWDALVVQFTRRAAKARRNGDDDDAAKWTNLSERAVNRDLSKQELLEHA